MSSGNGPQVHDAGTAAVAAELGRHTALLEQLVSRADRPRRQEDSRTFYSPNGAVLSDAFQPSVPRGPVEVQAWQTFASATVPVIAILDGDYGAGAPSWLPPSGQDHFTPVLMCIPDGGAGVVQVPEFSGVLTVVTVKSATTNGMVTVRVRAC